MKTVIIGGVAAGASCAARLRRLDEKAEIVLLERGPYISYANCGLPYHIGGVIRQRDALLVTTKETMEERFRVDVRSENEALSIDRDAKEVVIRDRASGRKYRESYDKLVIATGSSPLRPPIPGIDSARITTLWTVPDADRIRQMISENRAASAAVIGGGFIGLETAENLRHAGLEVTLIEAMDQVMAPLDPEMAALLHENIVDRGVDLRLSDGVDSFEDTGTKVRVDLASGASVSVDMVILSIGVRPNSQIARDAGLAVNERGGIITDEHLRTEDPDIYAAGDVIEVTDIVSRDKTMIPLAGPANKMGRIVADNIAGGSETYKGTQGSSVAKVFDLTAASTGSSEKTLKKRGLVKGRDYETLIITQNSHAGYYPGAQPLVLKLIFAKDGSRIFGAQIVGSEGVDKRIDTIGVAMRMGASVEDLKSLELAYAPPYSSAKDPVNMAGFTAENILRGLVKISEWDVADGERSAPSEDGEHTDIPAAPDENTDSESSDNNREVVLLDVREPMELMAYQIPGAVNIPLGQLRDRLGELDPCKTYVTLCAVGVRAYNAARILVNNGFENVQVYPGGVRFYASTHRDLEAGGHTASPSPSGGTRAATTALPEAAAADVKRITLDCCGMQCPGPITEVFKGINDLPEGGILEVTASDPGFARDIVSWCRRTGNILLSNEKSGTDYVAVIQKGQSENLQADPMQQIPGDSATDTSASGAKGLDVPLVPAGGGKQGKTIVVFDGDMDKVLASFIIANGALAMGRPVTMFFTFWGLTALRKSHRQPVKKTFMEGMFDRMLPRGSGKLKLSKMNMGGIGTAMMKGIMKDKNVDSLEDLMKKAMDMGVKIIACSMSMDVMGIRKEELIDGVEIGGVGTYLGEAEESNVNLFI